MTRVALFASILSVSAYIRIPIAYVPLTLQSTAALTPGYCLGAWYGAAATLLYTAVGLAGVPVFASGGGPAYVLSPTFGYILGFTVCAWITGFLAKLNRRGSVLSAYLIMLVGLVGIYIPGILWLGLSLQWIADIPVHAVSILKTGLVIPLIGDLITAVPAAVVSVRLRKILT